LGYKVHVVGVRSSGEEFDINFGIRQSCGENAHDIIKPSPVIDCVKIVPEEFNA
jgi:hypothetical protein